MANELIEQEMVLRSASKILTERVRDVFWKGAPLTEEDVTAAYLLHRAAQHVEVNMSGEEASRRGAERGQMCAVVRMAARL